MSRLRSIDRKLTEQLIDIDDQLLIIEDFNRINDSNFKTYHKFTLGFLIFQLLIFSLLKKHFIIISIAFTLGYLKFNKLILSVLNILLIITVSFYYRDKQIFLPFFDLVLVHSLQYYFNKMRSEVDNLKNLTYKYKSA